MKNEKKQNKIFLVGFVLIVLIFVWVIARPRLTSWLSGNGDEEKKINAEILKAPLITAGDLFKKIKGGEKISIFDLSSVDDFSRGHIQASTNISPDKLTAASLPGLGATKASSIVILNQGDDIFAVAQKTNELAAGGYPNARYLQDGLLGWKKEGLALVSKGGSAFDQSKVKKLAIAEVADEISAGADSVQFVDLRGENEFKTGHVPGALNLSPDNLEKDQPQLPSLKKIIVYGKNEEDASQAAVTLFDLNFFNVYVLEGGLDAWLGAGGKME